MTSPTDSQGRSPDRLEHEIAEEREALADTSAALKERLTVGSLVEEVLLGSRGHGGALAGQIGRAMRDNPVPLALVGIGLTMLMAGNRAGPAPGGGRSAQAPSYATMSDYAGPRNRHLGTADPQPSGIPRSGVDWDRREDEDDPGRERVRAGAAEAVRYGRRAGETLDEMVARQPLVVGGLALALGATLGGLLPNSRAENSAMGERADRLRAEAAHMAAEEGRKAHRVATAAADEAPRAADEAATSADRDTPGGREMVERAAERARETAERAAGAADAEARRQGLGASVDPDRR